MYDGRDARDPSVLHGWFAVRYLQCEFLELILYRGKVGARDLFQYFFSFALPSVGSPFGWGFVFWFPHLHNAQPAPFNVGVLQWVVHGCIPLQVCADCAFVKTGF